MGSDSTSPAPPSPPQHVESMAAEPDNRCPICLDSWEEASFAMPCLHQFCYACILRWAESKPECPVCKRRIISVVHSVWADDDSEENVITPSTASAVVGRQAGGALGRPAAHSPAAAERQPVEIQLPGAPPGGLRPNTWASLFRDHPALLQPLLTWVRQELGRIFGNGRSQAAVVEDLVTPLLVLFGLDEDLLVQLLRATLQNRTATFVHQLIDVAVQRCSGEARRLLGLEDGHAAGGAGGQPRGCPRPCCLPARVSHTWAGPLRQPRRSQSGRPPQHLRSCPSGGSRQPSPCPRSCPRGARRAPGGAPGGRGRSIYVQPGQGTLPWGATASPKEEGRQPRGLFSSQEEATPPAALEERPRRCRNQGWASSWGVRRPSRAPGPLIVRH
ncbi:uncharacterized protein LOC121232712 [Aquila chrysaetos chrysaetos]|uniref:uncharacterized protein LOC121232712 n=1 Tax=Aquila chrysaetos chrysaetos TaxID=223781 RepID=UPI001B7D38ED|nr:uncharacterized protein LOC121232712 [Aquila chrysaetos chrysaetos]